MSDLLVLAATTAEAVAAVDSEPLDAASAWPGQASGATSWAVQFHDTLGGRAATAAPASGDVAQVASWLRIQAVGRATVVVIEPRIARFGSLWSAGAALAGIQDVHLAVAADQSSEELLADASVGDTVEPAGEWRQGSFRPRSRRADRCKLWLVDRAEGTARRVVRGLQR